MHVVGPVDWQIDAGAHEVCDGGKELPQLHIIHVAIVEQTRKEMAAYCFLYF